MQEGLFDWEWFVERFDDLGRIDLMAYKRPQMERRINSFMKISQCEDYKAFIDRLETDAVLRQKFTAYITINVSEFFRNPDRWRVLEEKIVPLLLAERSPLKVWSAGCSTGEEAYSLAMLFAARFAGQVRKIQATDLDQSALSKAVDAVYSTKAAKTLPEEYHSRYLQPQEENFRIAGEIRKLVDFARHDLLKDPFGNDYDLILCRNVFIYLTENSKQELYRKFAAALRPGGVLFIGSTEQIFSAEQNGFKPLATFFYQKTL